MLEQQGAAVQSRNGGYEMTDLAGSSVDWYPARHTLECHFEETHFAATPQQATQCSCVTFVKHCALHDVRISVLQATASCTLDTHV